MTQECLRKRDPSSSDRSQTFELLSTPEAIVSSSAMDEHSTVFFSKQSVTPAVNLVQPGTLTLWRAPNFVSSRGCRNERMKERTNKRTNESINQSMTKSINQSILGRVSGIPCRFCRGGWHHHQLGEGERAWDGDHQTHSLIFDHYSM